MGTDLLGYEDSRQRILERQKKQCLQTLHEQTDVGENTCALFIVLGCTRLGVHTVFGHGYINSTKIDITPCGHFLQQQYCKSNQNLALVEPPSILMRVLPKCSP